MIPAVGAEPSGDGATRFTVWAPYSDRVGLRRLDDGSTVALDHLGHGYHGATVAGCPAGSRYRYVLADGRELADPASRAQPEGVHGPSAVVDPGAHRWGDAGYRPQPLADQVIYEIHLGAFSAGGTFDSAVAELDQLVEVGVSAVELMPLAQFPGRRNWGYDGVFPYAVQDSYGGAAGLQRFVDACHQRQLAVILDVVYNHLGPEGNVLAAYGPYFTDRYQTPWGPAVNFDGPASDEVREYFAGNARQWFVDFHLDALRLDAVHEFLDRTATPFLTDLSTRAAGWSEQLGRPCQLIAESADNNPRVVTPVVAGGLGLDAQWNDDFHHALHVTLTGERSGYYADYGGRYELARAMDAGFVYQGEHSTFRGRRHGAPSGALAPERFVLYAQNHDQIGNRPRGDRLATMVSPAQARMAAALLLLSPGIPMLFMGEEYGETAPFPYFIDHGDPRLVQTVREGRAREFAGEGEQGTPLDPAAEATFAAATLDRTLRQQGDHAALWTLHRDLIALRRSTPALRRSTRQAVRAWAGAQVLTLVRSHDAGTVAVLFNLSHQAAVGTLPDGADPGGGDGPAWADLLDPAAPGPEPDGAVALEPWEFRAYLGRGALT